jgi:hypothetical protein
LALPLQFASLHSEILIHYVVYCVSFLAFLENCSEDCFCSVDCFLIICAK